MPPVTRPLESRSIVQGFVWIRIVLLVASPQKFDGVARDVKYSDVRHIYRQVRTPNPFEAAFIYGEVPLRLGPPYCWAMRPQIGEKPSRFQWRVNQKHRLPNLSNIVSVASSNHLCFWVRWRRCSESLTCCNLCMYFKPSQHLGVFASCLSSTLLSVLVEWQ